MTAFPVIRPGGNRARFVASHASPAKDASKNREGPRDKLRRFLFATRSQTSPPVSKRTVQWPVQGGSFRNVIPEWMVRRCVAASARVCRRQQSQCVGRSVLPVV